MHILSPDGEQYLKAVSDMAHLIQVFGSKHILLDLKQFFPDQYEDMVKALNNEVKTKQLARLLDASQGRCSGIGMADSSVAVSGSRGFGGDK
jgi:hypothetical protein